MFIIVSISGRRANTADAQNSAITAIVVTAGGARAQSAPEIPTAQEIGYKDILIEGWYTFFAPARTPRPLVDAWSREIGAVGADPAVRERLGIRGLDPQPAAPDVVAERMDRDLRRWV